MGVAAANLSVLRLAGGVTDPGKRDEPAAGSMASEMKVVNSWVEAMRCEMKVGKVGQ